MILLLFNFFLYAKTHYHKDQDVDKVLEQATAIRNHSLQKGARSILDQIYANIDIKEIESMRRRLLSVSQSSNESYYKVEQEVMYEILYFYKAAIEKISGAKITSSYTPIQQSQSRSTFWSDETLIPIKSITDNVDAKNFRVHGSHIEFTFDNKVYKINPRLIGTTSFNLVSANAEKYQLAYDRCFKSTDGKSNCEDYKKAQEIEYRIRNVYITLENDQVAFNIRSTYDPDTKTGSLSLHDDIVTNTSFIAALMKSEIDQDVYINDEKIEYQFSAKQEEKIKQQRQEEGLFMPSKAKEIEKSKASH